MTTRLRNALTSGALTVLIALGGYIFFKPPAPPTLPYSGIEKEFADIYSNIPANPTTPRERLIADIKKSYNNTASPEILEKLKNPRESYPLLDKDMENFALEKIGTGKTTLTQNVYTCRLIGNSLKLNNEPVSQENYQITNIIASDINGYDVSCVEVIRETQSVLSSELPNTLLKIDKGIFEPLPVPEKPGVIVSFLGIYTGFLSFLKIPLMFGVIFFLLSFFGFSKTKIKEKVTEFKKKKEAKLLEPQSTDPVPVSFMDKKDSRVKV